MAPHGGLTDHVEGEISATWPLVRSPSLHQFNSTINHHFHHVNPSEYVKSAKRVFTSTPPWPQGGPVEIEVVRATSEPL